MMECGCAGGEEEREASIKQGIRHHTHEHTTRDKKDAQGRYLNFLPNLFIRVVLKECKKCSGFTRRYEKI